MKQLFQMASLLIALGGAAQASEQRFFEGISYEEPESLTEASFTVKDRFHDGRQVRWYIVRHSAEDKAARIDLMLYTLACKEPKATMTDILSTLLRENSHVSELRKIRHAKFESYMFDFNFEGQQSKERLIFAGQPGMCIAMKIVTEQPFVNFDRASSQHGWLGSGVIPSLVRSILESVTFHSNN